MAIYRFKVSFEDYDEVIREIDIKSNQTYLDLHKAIHSTTGYDTERSSSFYVSNDQWIKNEEIAYLPSQRKIDRIVATMDNCKISKFIEDPHQKFYYTYNFDRPFDFHVELIKIIINDEGIQYPQIVKTVGEAPRLPGTFNPIIIDDSEPEEFDSINEMDFVSEDTEELESLADVGINTDVPLVDEDEEKDEFSDSEDYDEEDLEKDE